VEPDPKPTAGIGSPARGTLMFFGSGFSLFTHQQNYFSVTSFTETAVVAYGNKEREYLNFLSIGEEGFFAHILRCCEIQRCKKTQFSLRSGV